MDKLGSIVLDKRSSTPLLVIAKINDFFRTIPLIGKGGSNFFKLSSKDFTSEDDYVSYNLGEYSLDCDKIITISSLNVQKIASLTEESYYMILRKYSSYQAALGATDRGYLLVRDEVHKQLIKKMDKGIINV